MPSQKPFDPNKTLYGVRLRDSDVRPPKLPKRRENEFDRWFDRNFNGIVFGVMISTIAVTGSLMLIRHFSPRNEEQAENTAQTQTEIRVVVRNAQVTEQDDRHNKYCTNQQHSDPLVRDKAVEIARQYQGNYNLNQILAIFEWMNKNIRYVNDPGIKGQEYVASAHETLETKAGDCEDKAILLASMINAIGGQAKVVDNNVCSHAFVLVKIANSESDWKRAARIIGSRYGETPNSWTFSGQQGFWLALDTGNNSVPGVIAEPCQTQEAKEHFHAYECLAFNDNAVPEIPRIQIPRPAVTQPSHEEDYRWLRNFDLPSGHSSSDSPQQPLPRTPFIPLRPHDPPMPSDNPYLRPQQPPRPETQEERARRIRQLMQQMDEESGYRDYDTE